MNDIRSFWNEKKTLTHSFVFVHRKALKSAQAPLDKAFPTLLVSRLLSASSLPPLTKATLTYLITTPM
jgi:hypothetical protein